MIRLNSKMTNLLKPGDVSAVRDSLQAAIKLEHAVIPPYLYALYSLVPGTNLEVAEIIKSVVAEEMLHLVLAANVLNAIGGRPELDGSSFIPVYPTALPGAVEKELVIGLRPCSIGLIEKTFMTIEQPERSVDAPDNVNDRPELTVGQFYRAIQVILTGIGDREFYSRPRNQITPDIMPRVIPVTDVASACCAINIIIDQGEGTAGTPLEIDGRNYSHYCRFKEIVKGERLIRNPNARSKVPYIYKGPPIEFEKANVIKLNGNRTKSLARRADHTFNYTYTSLLKSLHETLNGRQEQYQAAIGLMMSLKQQAIDMMTGTTTGNQRIGPTFKWQPSMKAE